MPLETGSFVNDLTPTNPAGSDPAGQGDDHIRLLKACVQGTFPQMGAVLGQVRRQDTALSISSTWNTNHFICSASATATVVLTLPPASSITSGYFVDITTIGTGTVSLLPSGAASINGGTSLSIPRLSTARAYFVTGTSWLADIVPHAQGGTSVLSNLAVDGTLSVSGASVLGALTVNGVATLSAAVTMKSTVSISGAVTLGTTLSVSGQTTLIGLLNLTVGQIAFPATQNPSAGANTLDDYEEGTFTPALTYATPGTFSVTYTTQAGRYVKIGQMVWIDVEITTLTFVRGTASGRLNLTGLPFSHAAETSYVACDIGGFVLVLTTVTQTDPTAVLSGTTTTVVFNMVDHASGNTSAINNNVVPGATNTINFQMCYRV